MSTPWIDLSGQVALVTGAASGIGRAAAIALAGAGAAVVAADLDEAGTEATAAAIRQAGGEGHGRRLDVTAQGDWDAARDWIAQKWDRLDILVNSAGVVFSDRAGDESLDIYRRTFAINVEGSLLGMALALHFMRPVGRGSIINLSSAAAFKGSSTMASYGASKSAIAHYSRSAALEVVRAGHDIRVNAVHPGLIDTAMADDFSEIYKMIGSKADVMRAMSSGRAGTPEEVADLILFLASDRARFISGASIAIDRAQSA